MCQDFYRACNAVEVTHPYGNNCDSNIMGCMVGLGKILCQKMFFTPSDENKSAYPHFHTACDRWTKTKLKHIWCLFIYLFVITENSLGLTTSLKAVWVHQCYTNWLKCELKLCSLLHRAARVIFTHAMLIFRP